MHTHYQDENRITKITKVDDNAIVVIDEMGTIRIFKYPCDSNNSNATSKTGGRENEGKSGNGYLKCYADHLNYINQSVVSSDNHNLVTTSEVDRCIFIWEISANAKPKPEDPLSEPGSDEK